MIPDFRFPGGFQITATYGTLRWVQRGTTVASCLAWGARMREHGWEVSEPVPYTPKVPGDMGRLNELIDVVARPARQDEGSSAA